MNGLRGKRKNQGSRYHQPQGEPQVRSPLPTAFLHAALSILLCTLLFSRDAHAQSNDSSVTIIRAGIQSSEDAPFISPGFRFFPGDFVHATFQVSNFTRKQQNSEAPPKISLAFEARLEDANGTLLAPPEKGDIESELSAEDKNWTPKRRVSFTLPPFIGSGKAQLRLSVKDALGGTETSRSLPFTIGGVAVLKSDSLAVQDFHFFRRENDADALEMPAFTPGDAVFAKFNMAGFKTGDRNTYRLVYDVLVLRPDGKPFIQQPHAAELTSDGFYPAQYLPAVLELTTAANSAKGVYAVIVTVHDLIGNATFQAKSAFTLE